VRRTARKLRVRTKGLVAGGRPRVIEDVELYHQVMATVDDPKIGAGDLHVRELGEMVMLTLEHMPTWGVGIMAMRARLFLGCIRKELGRRESLDPNQLQLKGL